MIKSAEQRTHMRWPIRAHAELRLENGMLMEGQSRDVSLNGVLLTSERILPVGNSCRVSLVMDAEMQAIRIDVHGHVVRMDEMGIAIEFSHVDVENFDRLRQYVMRQAEESEVD